MLKEKIQKFAKVENIVFLIILLIVTIIIINYILKEKKSPVEYENSSSSKSLADIQNESDKQSSDLQTNLEKILSTIKGVGKVNVFISYSESSKTIAMYDEKTTTSSTEETDSSRRLKKHYFNRSSKRCYFFRKGRKSDTYDRKNNNANYRRSCNYSARCQKRECKN